MSTSLNPQPPSRRAGRYLEAVIVAVNYADFLEETLAWNKQYFDHITVVTSFDDKETHRVCRLNNIDPVKTNEFWEDGAAFNKAAGINLGLAHARYNDWILHLDADVLLPHDFRNLLWQYPLKQDCIYGADRINIVGRKAYEKLIASKEFRHQYLEKFLNVVPPQSDRAARLVHKEMGWLPLGYYQLFNGKYLGDHQLRYPDQNHTRSAERSDVLFSLQWKRENRILLPNVTVFHLESEARPQGVNWFGRKSCKF